MNIFRNLTVRVGADVSGLAANMQRAVGVMRSAARTMAQSMDQVGESMERVGSTLSMRITAPLLLMAQQTARTAGDFEAAMIRLQAISGATAVEIERLRLKAEEMGATTKFSASDAAEALNFMAMAGLNATASLNALPYVLQLAASAGLDMARATDIAMSIMAGYRMEVSGLAHANDVLVLTMNATNTGLVELGEAMKYAGPIASAAGVQFEEAAAILGFMGNAGIQASMAGTSLRGAISRLVNPTDQITRALRAAGVQTTDANGRLLSLVDIIRQLTPHANDAGLMMEIFGDRAGPAMAAVISQGVGALEQLIVQLELSEGTAGEVADAYNEGLNGALSSLSSSVEALMLAIGRAGLTETLTNWANSLADLARALAGVNPALLGTVTAILALAAALPPLIVIMGTLIRSFGLIFGALAGPAGIIGAILAIVGTASLWHQLAAEIRGVETATRAASEPMERMAEIAQQIATSTGDAREALRGLAQEQANMLRAQATVDEARVRSLEEGQSRVADRMNMQIEARTGRAGNVTAAGLSPTAELIEARARARTSRAAYTSSLDTLYEADYGAERRAEYERVMASYMRYRAARPDDVSEEDWRRQYLERNPRNAHILDQGPGSSMTPTRGGNGGAAELSMLDLNQENAADRPPPSVTRAQELSGLREQVELAHLTANELERLTAIQEVMNEAANAGEAITREQAEAFVDERDALQNTIDARQEAAEQMDRQISANVALRAETAQSIRDQYELAAAAMQSAEAYERLRIVQDLMSRNPGLSREDAEEMADGIYRAGEAVGRATEHMGRMQDLARGIGEAFGSAFEKAILDGERLGDVLRSLGRDVAALVLRATVTVPLANGISNAINGVMGGSSSGGGGGWLSSIFGGLTGAGTGDANNPGDKGGGGFNVGDIWGAVGSSFAGFFAEGGFIPPGKWGVAGEYGPEPIFGGNTGVSVQSNQGGGGQVVYSPTYNFQGTSEELAQFRREAANDRAAFQQRVKGIVGDMAQRGRL